MLELQVLRLAEFSAVLYTLNEVLVSNLCIVLTLSYIDVTTLDS